MASLWLLAAVAFLCATGDARAQPIFVNYTWNNPSGGSYHTGSNWTPSSGFGGIPDSGNEGALFNLDEEYIVLLSSDISTNSVLARDGAVALALGAAADPRTYTLGSLTVEPPAGGGDPHLLVFDGTLRASTIRVADGGRLTLDTDVLHFDNGAVTGAGSTWSQTTGFLRVGENGTGTLLVEDGGTVENADGAAIGRFAGSNGTATVTGDGSTFDVSANISVGQEGTGTLIVEDGGSVFSTTGRVAATSSDSVGMVTVTGDGSRWILSDELLVGESGEGTLLIEAGGNVSNTRGIIGANASSTGSATVTGAGSTWTTTNVGISVLRGTLTIEAGGSVSSIRGDVSGLTPTSAAVSVTGADSTWTMSRELRVGHSSSSNPFDLHGMLTISDGGSVSNTDGFIGSGLDFSTSGSTGAVIVTGAGST